MFQFLVELVFPKKCINCRKIGDFLCSNCFSLISFNNSYSCCVCLRPCIDGFTHPGCKKNFTLDAVIPAVSYKGVVKKLLYQYKYKPYLYSLEKLMGEIMYEGIIQNESLVASLDNAIITAVPLHKSKNRKRGYNHAELLAKRVAALLNKKFYPNILIRIKDTKPQYMLKKEERAKNIKGAFSVLRKAEEDNLGSNQSKFMSHNIGLDINNKEIVLVDDVATTYSTLKECALVLKKNGAKKVMAITFAKEA